MSQAGNPVVGRQVPLPLSTKDPLSERYFVAHSGVVAASALVDAHLQSLTQAVASSEGQGGVVFFLHGSAGVGKSHFLRRSLQRATDLGISRVFVYDDLCPETCASIEWSSRFVSDYQAVMAEPGVLFAASTYQPQELSEEPSVRSRLCSAQLLHLQPPSEEELPPILQSIAERKNLQLSSRNIEYIVRRLPRTPLSFEHLFATIDQLCLCSGEPAKLKMIRSLLSGEQKSSS